MNGKAARVTVDGELMRQRADQAAAEVAQAVRPESASGILRTAVVTAVVSNGYELDFAGPGNTFRAVTGAVPKTGDTVCLLPNRNDWVIFGVIPALGVAPAVPQAQAIRGTAFPVNDNTPTAIIWDADHYDNNGIHSLVTNQTRFTPPTPGWYEVFAQVVYPVTASAAGFREARLFKNGALVAAGRIALPGSTTAAVVPQICGLAVDCDGDDYLELIAYHNSGTATVNLTAASGQNSFMRVKWAAPLDGLT